MTVMASLGACVMRVAPSHRIVGLPAGVVQVRSEILVDSGTEVRGAPSGTMLRNSRG